MEKNYNFNLVYKKYNKTSVIISALIKGLVFGLLIMLLAGYLMGYRVFSVLGYSSEPNIHYGSIVIDYKVPFKELKVGDYITWSRSGRTYVTHQIIEIDYDNNSITTSQTDHFVEEGETVTPDAPITYEQCKGKVIATIPEVGNILLSFKNLVLKNNTINILGLMTLTLIFTSYYLFKGLIRKETYTIKEY